jgi:hypothetical protein
MESIMTIVYSGTAFYCDVVFDDVSCSYYLLALCGGIAWGHVGIKMNEQEIQAFQQAPSSVEAVARAMCRDFSQFADRSVPEDVQHSILEVFS